MSEKKTVQEKLDNFSKGADKVGNQLQRIGCGLTLLVTFPILGLIFFGGLGLIIGLVLGFIIFAGVAGKK